jgi:plasmid stability protein
MASLHVRNIEDEIVRKLKGRAERNGRSAEAEHREILRRALEWERAPVSDSGLSWDERAAQMRELTKGSVQTPSEILLRESRDER